MKKTRSEQEKSIWISGINPATEALTAGSLEIREMILARADHRVEELERLCRNKGIPIRSEARDALSALVGHRHHQGVALRAAEYVYTPLESLLDRSLSDREPLVILDCIQDPQNLGALTRSACFLGARGIVIPKDRSAQVTATVIKIAAGATAYLPVVQVTNLARALEQLKEAGLWIMGLDLQAEKTLYEVQLTVPLGLVIGNEQNGLRPLIRRHCDVLVRIPGNGPLQSLNAAAAGAVALAEVQRQRLEIH